MAETDGNFSATLPPASARSTGQVILASAVEAIASTAVLWLLGGIAVSIASSFTGEMIPSLPPGFAGHNSWEGSLQGSWHLLRESAFILFFAIFFIHSLWVGFHERRGKRIPRMVANLREHWFGLIIGNAIGAWVAVLVLNSLPNLSLWHFLGQYIWEFIRPLVGAGAHSAFGDSASGGLSDWLSWLNANQMKLTFWIIYIGGAFDDLGVPNYKTLARWAWRRMHQRRKTDLRATDERAGGGSIPGKV